MFNFHVFYSQTKFCHRVMTTHTDRRVDSCYVPADRLATGPQPSAICTLSCRMDLAYSFPWITLTNLSIILQFLTHIISKVRFTKNV